MPRILPGKFKLNRHLVFLLAESGNFAGQPGLYSTLLMSSSSQPLLPDRVHSVTFPCWLQRLTQGRQWPQPRSPESLPRMSVSDFEKKWSSLSFLFVGMWVWQCAWPLSPPHGESPLREIKARAWLACSSFPSMSYLHSLPVTSLLCLSQVKLTPPGPKPIHSSNSWVKPPEL